MFPNAWKELQDRTSFLLVEAHNHTSTAALVSEQSLLLQPQGTGCLLMVGPSLILQITTRRPEAAQKWSSSCKGSAMILTACRYPTPLLRPVCQKFSEAGGWGKPQYLLCVISWPRDEQGRPSTPPGSVRMALAVKMSVLQLTVRHKAKLARGHVLQPSRFHSPLF